MSIKLDKEFDEKNGADKETITVEFEEIPFEEKVVRNNGENIGNSKVYSKNLKRTLLFASYVLVGTLCYLGGVSHKDSKSSTINFSVNTLDESYFDEPTYNGILYEVKMGDTLTEIVYGYQSDANKVEQIISEIERVNKIQASRLRDGQVIYLCGVPSSKLEEFGYSDNYNYFDPSVEIDMRFSFLEMVLTNIDVEVGEELRTGYDDVVDRYRRYKYTYLPGDDSALDEIIEDLRYLSDSARQYGFDFENNKKAVPLSEAINYNKENVHRY